MGGDSLPAEIGVSRQTFIAGNGGGDLKLRPGPGFERIEEVENGSPLLAAAFELRREVFVAEQGVPAELEIDELDPGAIHLVAILDEKVVGTLRILRHEGAAKIGRVAVRAAARRAGIGGRLMERAGEIARQRGFAEIILHAQVSVAGFYRRLGYVEEGDPFEEAGIAHIAMRKTIAR
jgi:predicted GNAT family N-acyltransferase